MADTKDISEIIKMRRSVRTFNRKNLTDEDLAQIKEFISDVKNPYGIPVEFRLLDPKEYGLKSKVLKGEELYLGAKIKKVPHFEEAFGYSFEAVVLFAQSLNVGTVWMASTMNRKKKKKAMELGEEEIMPCVSPLGYPADKMSVVETVMRKTIGADKRAGIDEIAFEQEFGNSIKGCEDKLLENAIEMVRLAPSAKNMQPWRMIISGNSVHFYEKKDPGFDREEAGDIQKIDIGIAMYHFAKVMESGGRAVTLKTDDPGLKVTEGVVYISTYSW